MSDRTEALQRSIRKGKELIDKIERLPVDPQDLKTAEGRKAALAAIRSQLREQAAEMADLARKKALEAVRNAINNHEKLKDEISGLLGDDWMEKPGQKLPRDLLDKYRDSRALREQALKALRESADLPGASDELPMLQKQIDLALKAIAEKQAIRHGQAYVMSEATRLITDELPGRVVLIECDRSLADLARSSQNFMAEKAKQAQAAATQQAEAARKAVGSEAKRLSDARDVLESKIAQKEAEVRDMLRRIQEEEYPAIEDVKKRIERLQKDVRALESEKRSRLAELAREKDALLNSIKQRHEQVSGYRDEIARLKNEAKNAADALKGLL